MKSIIEHEEPLELFVTFDYVAVPAGWSGTPNDLSTLLTSEPRINIKLGKNDRVDSGIGHSSKSRRAIELPKDKDKIEISDSDFKKAWPELDPWA